MSDLRPGLLLTDVEVHGQRVDVRVGRGEVVEFGRNLPGRGDSIIPGHGGALLPGLHDHHLHLNAMAAARRSVSVGPPQVRSAEDLALALSSAPGTNGWIRAVGYHESVAGPLDRDSLDALVPGRPVRVQHRSGALWVLNSRALDRVAMHLDGTADVERDASGRPTGRLWRYDQRLASALPSEETAQREALRDLTRDLLRLGLTGVTDATPDLDAVAISMLEETMPLRVHLLGAPGLEPLPRRMTRGPRKILLRDHDLPSYDRLRAMVELGAAERKRDPVAVHCVTREALFLTLAVLEEVGSVPGDRIEHASLVPAGAETLLERLGVTVVTQPDFLRTRGDAYIREVEDDDRECLYRWRGLSDAGISVAPSSDAPFGDVDPWRVIRSSHERISSSGALIGPAERVSTAEALRGYLSEPDAPGRKERRVTIGSRDDLCLLGVPLREALADPRADHVVMTIAQGVPVSIREPGT